MHNEFLGAVKVIFAQSLLKSKSEPLAPRMDRWSSLRIRLQEMVQDAQQSQHMALIAAIELRVANIIDNHVTNFFAAVL